MNVDQDLDIDDEWNRSMMQNTKWRWVACMSIDGARCAVVTEVVGGYLAAYSGKVLGTKSNLAGAMGLCRVEHRRANSVDVPYWIGHWFMMGLGSAVGFVLSFIWWLCWR